jgi:hypothetical protein
MLRCFAEFRISLSLVIEVNGIGCTNKNNQSLMPAPGDTWYRCFLPSRPVIIVLVETATKVEVFIVRRL